MWSKIIYRYKDQMSDKAGLPEDSLRQLSGHVAAGLYEDIINDTRLSFRGRKIFPVFSDLPPEEKEIWYSYADGIPGKLATLNLFIRPFKEFCRTCIITGSEIETLNRIDYKVSGREKDQGTSNMANIHPLRKLGKDKGIEIRNPELELNLLIPAQIKKAGFEIIRDEEAMEIDHAVVNKLARVIHSKYLRKIKNSKKSDTLSGFYNAYQPEEVSYPENFNDLPADIKYSNLDNAYHIPTKLLSIGYKIRPLSKGYKSFTLTLSDEEIETMSKVEHLRWCWEKRLNGWHYGEKRDNKKKNHPGLVEYDELDESEKDKDRELVKLIPALLKDIGYEAYPVAPDRVRKLSYAIKPQSTIHLLLTETHNLANEIASLTGFSPEITDRLISIRNKLETSIKEVQGSYNYASHIQEVFLPENIFIRECFPESFVLFKPKNIVSGDFYFFSRQKNLIIFALADCTGHGIPAALISTIGYGNLDQVVNVKGITDPPLILEQLYSSIHRFMRRDLQGYGLEDDMDITLCSFNTSDNTLTISGMGNHIFYCKKDRIDYIRPDHYYADPFSGTGYKFSPWVREVKPGETIYLFSDGFADQYGGKRNKRYQRTRLKNFLSSIQEHSLAMQNDMLYIELEKWRMEANAEQTDDITVVGIRF